MVLYTHDEIPQAFADVIKARNPEAALDDLVARDWPAVRALCERYISVGFSKLVLVPLIEPPDWDTELAAGSQAVLPLTVTDRWSNTDLRRH